MMHGIAQVTFFLKSLLLRLLMVMMSGVFCPGCFGKQVLVSINNILTRYKANE